MANFFDGQEQPIRRISNRQDIFLTNLYQSRKFQRSNLNASMQQNSASTPKSVRWKGEQIEQLQDQRRGKKLKLVSKLVLMHLQSDKYFPAEYQPYLKKMNTNIQKEQYISNRLRKRLNQINQSISAHQK